MTTHARIGVTILLMLTIAGCAGTGGRDAGPAQAPDASRIPDPVPRAEPRSRYGNPESYVVNGQRYHVMASGDGHVEQGIASWYGTKFHGRRTSSGETYDMYAMTAAHARLPLPTYARVTNLENGRSVVVRINDRGPFAKNRIIDLSYTAAQKLDMVRKGTALVEVRALDPGQPDPGAAPVYVDAGQPLGGHRIFVQVGAFSSEQNAERLRANLASHTLGSVRLFQAQVPGQGAVYRVRIGPLASVDQADRLTQELERIGHGDYRIVVD
ncbi:MAG: septal ring lytic transglycosylase RlpA family protein [Chromatiales bacterium]|nr:septal ring lytic transglycosylase RlpA family protein [Chromatiales bacterium]